MNTIFKEIGKAVVIEGTKAIVLGAGVTVIVTLVTTGPEGLKALALRDLLK
ncbi:MAG: hypothetical protein RR643_04955 [Anaerorhabdus sp.]|uniref:hypothetical protein n=1 Tax=Anaerorhabdus sp. TaxID=1872524 RepID=UPI002FC8CE0B